MVNSNAVQKYNILYVEKMKIQDNVNVSNIVSLEKWWVNRELVLTNLPNSTIVDKWIILYTGLKLK